MPPSSSKWSVTSSRRLSMPLRQLHRDGPAPPLAGRHVAEHELAPVEERVLLGGGPRAQPPEGRVAAVLDRHRPGDRLAGAEVLPGRGRDRDDRARRAAARGGPCVQSTPSSPQPLLEPRLLLGLPLAPRAPSPPRAAARASGCGARRGARGRSGSGSPRRARPGSASRLLVLDLLRRELEASVVGGAASAAVPLQRLRDLVLLLVEQVAELERRLLDARASSPSAAAPSACPAPPGFDEVAVEVRLAHRARRREQVHLLLQRAAREEQHVRRDADLLDRDVTRGEVLRDGELQRGLLPRAGGVVQVVEHLHRALAEGLTPDDERALVVLERARHDLARGGGAVVHDDDERQAREIARLVRSPPSPRGSAGDRRRPPSSR